MEFLEPGQDGRRVSGVGDGVAHLDFLGALDVGGHVAGFAGLQFLADVGFGIEAADFLDFDGFAGVQQFDVHARLQFAVEDADMGDDAFVGVEVGIEAEGLHGRRAGGFGRRNARDDGLENFVNADPLLGAGQNGGVARNGQDVFHLRFWSGGCRRGAGQFY